MEHETLHYSKDEILLNDKLRTRNVKDDSSAKAEPTYTEISGRRYMKQRQNNEKVEREKVIDDRNINRRSRSKSYSVNSRVDDRKRRVDDRRTRVDDHRTRVDDHRTRVDDHRTRVDNHRTRVDNRRTRVDDRKTRVDDRKTRVDDRKTHAIRPNVKMLNSVVQSHIRTNDRMDEEELQKAQRALALLDTSGHKVQLMTEYLTKL